MWGERMLYVGREDAICGERKWETGVLYVRVAGSMGGMDGQDRAGRVQSKMSFSGGGRRL